MGANVKSNPTRPYTSHQGTCPSRKANGRNMINGVHCVKFNKGIALDELICKASNKVYIPKIQPTSDKTIKAKQSEAPKPQPPLPRCYASDYMCCWGKDGKIVVNYVGA
jgi:hypothetical protein